MTGPRRSWSWRGSCSSATQTATGNGLSAWCERRSVSSQTTPKALRPQALLAMLLDEPEAYGEAWSASDLLPAEERLRLASAYARSLASAGNGAEALELGERALALADELERCTASRSRSWLADCSQELGDDAASERYGRPAVGHWETVRQDGEVPDQLPAARGARGTAPEARPEEHRRG